MSKFRCDYIYFGDYKMPVSEDEDAGLDSLIEAIHMYRNKEISSTELLASLACTQQIVKNTETIRNSRERIYKELVHNFVDLKQYIDKLKARYPEKFTVEDSLNRDYKKESEQSGLTVK